MSTSTRPSPAASPRRVLPGRLGARPLQANRPGRCRVHPLGRGLIVIGEGPERLSTGRTGRSNGEVPGLAARPGHSRSLSTLPCLALSWRRRLRNCPDRGTRLRCARHCTGSRRRGRDRRQRGRPYLRRALRGRPPRRNRPLGGRRDVRATRKKHDARAESLSLPVFRQRIFKLLAEVTAGNAFHHMPPAPHLRDLNRQATMQVD